VRRYAKEGEARLEPSNVRLTWGRPEWFPNVAREHAACRDAAALIDMSFMSKFRVQVGAPGALPSHAAPLPVAAVEARPVPPARLTDLRRARSITKRGAPRDRSQRCKPACRQGEDAGPFLNRLSTANVDGECGVITYALRCARSFGRARTQPAVFASGTVQLAGFSPAV
jgi:hypothetical protein